MNERFNDLRLDAGISRLKDEPKIMVAVSEEGNVIEPLDGLQKFAELIVRECAQQCWTVSELESKGSVVNECAKRIRKHFGVES
jgi:uncharacterized protein YkvS